MEKFQKLHVMTICTKIPNYAIDSEGAFTLNLKENPYIIINTPENNRACWDVSADHLARHIL